MRYLLDTHTLLWGLYDSSELSSEVIRIMSLPFIHKDPFDRIIIAQAKEENLTILTKDSNIPLYDIKTLW